MFELTTMRMKHGKLFIVTALLAVAFSLFQCGGDPAPAKDPQDEQLEKLTATWKVTTANGVTFNSTPVTGYDSFTMTITGTAGQDTFNYTITGRPSAPTLTPWAASGTFTFGTDFSTIVNRDDGTVITYSVSATTLQMTFTYTGAGYTASRVSNVNGTWSFTMAIQ